MLVGRLSVERAHGRCGPSGFQSEDTEAGVPDPRPNVVTEAGDDGRSSNGLVAGSSSSGTTSEGPNDLDASGDVTGGREMRGPSAETGDREPALMTSALTTRTLPFTGVMIMGASLRKSLAKLAPDMYEFRDETPEMPEICDGA